MAGARGACHEGGMQHRESRVRTVGPPELCYESKVSWQLEWRVGRTRSEPAKGKVWSCLAVVFEGDKEGRVGKVELPGIE